MAEIHHLENWHDVIFFCRGWSNLDKISETDAEWHVNCGDVVEIETWCTIPIWWTFGRIPWHVIPEPPSTLQGAATGRIQWHVIPVPRVTAWCCRLVNFTVAIPDLYATLQKRAKRQGDSIFSGFLTQRQQ